MNSNQNPRFLNNTLRNTAFVLLAVFCLSGCATRHMALDACKGNLGKLTKPVGIFTLRTENAYKPSYEPEVRRVKVVSNTSRDETTFLPVKPYKKEKNQYLEYLVSVDLDSGGYSLGRVEGIASAFLVQGHFEFPVNARFELAPGITYLGNVTMTNRQRKEGEERSGGVFPLIDQAATGFAGGTFDITITDRSETDIPDFIQAYPTLKSATINKAIMAK